MLSSDFSDRYARFAFTKNLHNLAFYELRLPHPHLLKAAEIFIFTLFTFPVSLRDNGPENINEAIQAWGKRLGIKILYIHPGKPKQNAYIERFNRTVRYQWLSQCY